MKKLFILSLGLSALIGCASDASDKHDSADSDSDTDTDSDNSTADNASSTDVDQDGAAASLAAERGISLVEATQRMAWQDKLDDLGAALQNQLATSFAGVWVDPDHGDRVQVAVTADASAADVLAIAQELGLDAATDVVRVPRSQAQLQSIVDDAVAQTGDGANVAIGIDPIANVVTLTIAPGGTEFRAIADGLVRVYGDAIQIQAPVMATPNRTSFDPPIRGGVEMHHSTDTAEIFCTTGFYARGTASTHLRYILSAGHCVTDAGDSGAWTANFANGTAHLLTNGGSYKVNEGGDMSALLMTNVSTWKPQPWIVVQKGSSTSFNSKYGITGNAGSHVGARVCHTGITSGTHCGTIQKLDVPISYDGKTIIGHQVQTSMAGKPGDSGGPVFASHKALGTFNASGATASYYEPIAQTESQMGVEVAHCVAKGGTVSHQSQCCSLESAASHSPDFRVCQ